MISLLGRFLRNVPEPSVTSIPGGIVSPPTPATHKVKKQTRDLIDELERMTLLNQAMWELIRDRLNLSDEDLERKVQEVDMRDGKRDGKMSVHPLRCPQCGRISNSRLKKCLYCGLEFKGDIFA
ncbi:MAG: hypothetical protein ACOYI9_02855 [Candidatus Hydrogenedentales bacterium]|jgi:hypothetical protein